MCLVTIYRDRVAEDTKLAEEVMEYTLDLSTGRLVASGLSGQATFDVGSSVHWREADDVLVIS